MNKTERLLDALEHPQNYSADELESMVSDPEIKPLYEVLCAVRGSSYARTPADGEVDEQWRRLTGISEGRWRHFVKRMGYRKGAAVVALISFSVLAGGIAIGLNLNSPGKDSKSGVAGPMTAQLSEAKETVCADTVRTGLPAEITFRNETLAAILEKLAPYYGLKVIYKSDASRNVQLYLPWSKDITASELVDLLNTFERIRLVLDGQNLIVY